ncbi:MAG: long-chain-fatty-acid--CoA ligase [Desulfatibacillaceae bacterium]
MDLGGLVARNARTVPDKEGFIYEDRRYTWLTVNERVNAVANALLAHGLKKGDKVAMWCLNTDNFAFAFYGIAKAGGVAVPVNYRLAAPEAEYIFNDSDAVGVIFDDFFQPVIDEMKPRLNNVRFYYSAGTERYAGYDAIEDVMDSGDRNEPPVKVDEFDHSEILYTSGTTGRPKGALFCHHNHMVLVTTIACLISITPDDRLLHAAPLFHAAELNLYMNPGTYLGCTQVIQRDFIPQRVLQLIQDEKVTQFFGAPIMYTLLMGQPDFDKYDLTSVKYYGYGAAPMAAEAVRKMIHKFGTDSFFCLCGYTEAGPGGVALQPKDQIRKAGAGGKYIVNMECRLVDEQGNTVTEPGVVGEFAIKGETTMLEYYKKPEATAETIRDGWVHSGDLGVLDDEGYITLVDRKKDMIITGGENVYSKEVEDALFENPKIADASIIGVPHPDWGETVMAVVALQKGETMTLEELREFLSTRIADYKRPRLLQVVDALPRNVSGKVLKYQLREQFKDANK